MVAYQKPEYVTPEEYLEGEIRNNYKSEYFGGVVVAMAGADTPHTRISGDVFGELRYQLKRKPCEAFNNEMLVRVPECDRYYYPDVSVACGPQFQRYRGLGVLLNPVVIVEVLSKSTQELDRGEKMECYRTLESLQVYILLKQDVPHAEVFTRHADNQWLHEVVKGLDAVIQLPSIGCDLPLAEAYAHIEFPPALTPSEAELEE